MALAAERTADRNERPGAVCGRNDAMEIIGHVAQVGQTLARVAEPDPARSLVQARTNLRITASTKRRAITPVWAPATGTTRGLPEIAQ